MNQPVTGAELDSWVAQVLPGAEGQVFHINYGILEADEEREETTANLPDGQLRLDLGLPESAAGIVQRRAMTTPNWWT